MAETEIQSKLRTVLGYGEKCVTRALYQMRGKMQSIAFVRKPYLGKTKTGNIAKIQGEPKLEWLVEHGHGENPMPHYSSNYRVQQK